VTRIAHRLLGAAGLFLAVSLSTAPATADTSARSLNEFVAADFDGDRSPDLASFGPRRHDGTGYLQDVQISLGPAGKETVRVHTASPVLRVTARDLDGDTDRDLVLESFDREPLAVLLNDGSGRFHEGNLADYSARLSGRTQYSIEGSGPASATADFDLGSGSDTADLDGIEPFAVRGAGRFRPPARLAGLLFHHANTSTRGPPCRP
jgi:hypothetical protein